MEIVMEPIGTIHSPFKKKEDIKRSRNIDPKGFDNVQGKLEIFSKFAGGLKDIDGFSHIILIFAFHESTEKKISATPPHDGKKHGVFATRSPNRPNPVGFSVLRLIGREDNVMHVQGIDMIEGTPILDIKPYTPRDQKPEARFGWLEKWIGKEP
jgi:tRNA-Thr(GGU) m(6)t(6)A37 methyltransferase TsaA